MSDYFQLDREIRKILSKICLLDETLKNIAMDVRELQASSRKLDETVRKLMWTQPPGAPSND